MVTANIAAEPKPASAKREFIRHYGTTVIGQALILGMGVVTGILAARMLGPAGRGELAAIVIWPTSIAALISLGVNQAIAYNVGSRLFSVDEFGTGALVIGLVQSALPWASACSWFRIRWPTTLPRCGTWGLCSCC